jgi:hypothetical protein
MAVIARDFSTLKKGRIQYGALLVVFVTLALYLVITLRGWPRLLAILPFAGVLFCSRFYFGFTSGLTLEGKVTRILKELPDDYYIVQDIALMGDGRALKIHHLVLAPRGMFLLETRHRQGRIVSEGTYWHQYWVREHNILPNPVDQAQEKADLLRGLLRDRAEKMGMTTDDIDNLWIQPVVIFTNNKVELKVIAEKVPIFKLDEFEKYIHSFKKKVAFSEEHREAMIPVLKELNLAK